MRRVINENEMNLRVIARQNEDLKANMTRLESEMKEKDLKSSDSYQQMIMYKDLLDIANRENAQLNDNLTKKDLQRQVYISTNCAHSISLRQVRLIH